MGTCCEDCLVQKVREYIGYSSNKAVTVQHVGWWGVEGSPNVKCDVCKKEPAEFEVSYPV